MQAEIARLLCAPEGGPSLFLVGDAKQSIYYFRGAEVKVFLSERERADHTLPLRRNFRSLPDVLNFVNEFFVRSEMLGAVERYQPMATHREAREESRIEFLLTEAPPQGTGKWLAEDYRRDEAALIAERIAALCGEETGRRGFRRRDRRLAPRILRGRGAAFPGAVQCAPL